MRVKCLAHEHNAMSWLGLEPGPLDPELSALIMRPLRLPKNKQSISTWQITGVKLGEVKSGD